MLNRHFYFLILSVFFIGIIFWWQTPESSISAMVEGKQNSHPLAVVKDYWKRMDYRQFDLASTLVTETAKKEHAYLEKVLTENPFLSIQRITCEAGSNQNEVPVKILFGSAIDEGKQINYLFELELREGRWLITSITSLSN